MIICPIQNNINPRFKGKLKSRFLPEMLKNFSEKELAEYNTLITKAENIKDGRLFGILKGHKNDLSTNKDYFEYYQFIEVYPETENTLAPISHCIKDVLSKKVFFIRKGYNDKEFPKAAVEVILEPLRKLYK